jgi:glycosyltransferase involved in cell wall biosynthesis
MIDQVAFYAPLKPPDHPTPSGDRRMARALVKLLEQSGREVTLASRLRSYDRNGDPERQRRIGLLGKRFAGRLIQRYRKIVPENRPKAWVTYHGYHKSPDWLGPAVQRALGIPYLLIETSFAPKQADGPWDLGHRATEAAIGSADVLLAMTHVDEAGLLPLVRPPAKLRRLPPFLDPAPYREARGARVRFRRELGERFGLDPDQPWLLAVGMMRDDVKRQSYEMLAQVLERLKGRSWQLLIVGGGPSLPRIEKAFEAFGSTRVRYAGILAESQLPACYAVADVYAWPAIREAYGMAFLEAQASGLPVVAGHAGGVRDVVQDGVTGMLTDPRDSDAMASALARLLDDPVKREAMSLAARTYVEREHSLERASALLDEALGDAVEVCALREKRAKPLDSGSPMAFEAGDAH